MSMYGKMLAAEERLKPADQSMRRKNLALKDSFSFAKRVENLAASARHSAYGFFAKSPIL